MDYRTILFDVSEGIATITLNRPEAYNSFTRDMTNEFTDVWNRIRDDDAVRAIVLQAAPCPAFCSGADVKGGLELHLTACRTRVRNHGRWMILRNLSDRNPTRSGNR